LLDVVALPGLGGPRSAAGRYQGAAAADRFDV